MDKQKAIETIGKMTRRQLNGLYYDLTCEGWYTDDKRKLRAFAYEVVNYNWDIDSVAIARCIMNNI